MKHGKRYVEAAKAVDRATLYDAADAIALVKKTAVAKFDETIEAHIRTGCDGRHADSRSVVQLFCRTVLVKLPESLFSLRVQRLTRLRLQAQIS